MAGAVSVAAAQGQQPVAGPRGGAGIPIRKIEEGETNLRGEPGGQLGGVVEARRGEGAIAQALDRGGGLPAVPGRCHGPGIGHGFLTIAEQVEAEGGLARHEACGPRQAGRTVLEGQGAPLPHQPPAGAAQGEGQQAEGQQHRQERPGLHSPLAGWSHPDARPTRRPP